MYSDVCVRARPDIHGTQLHRTLANATLLAHGKTIMVFGFEVSTDNVVLQGCVQGTSEDALAFLAVHVQFWLPCSSICLPSLST